jgi:2-oxo-4-hydroxy-4-carboxy-5-ureidoimidazoline decarboxylase
MKIDEINRLPRERFVEALGWVFEDSPWVAERAWERRPFDSVEALHDAMTGAVEAAAREEQLALLRAHPDLGARAKMSTASVGEQAGAGLDSLTAREFETLRDLNLAYRTKFGFPFLYAVRGAGKQQILAALERRFGSDGEAEFREALRQVYRIAGFRLEQLTADR